MLTIRVDGNDALAVRSAVQAAKAKALAHHVFALVAEWVTDKTRSRVYIVGWSTIRSDWLRR